MQHRIETPQTTTSELLVKRLEADDVHRWNRFVDSCSESTFFHKAEWRDVIEQTFGHRTHYLYAEQGGRVQGVLPLAEIRSFLFGHSLVSTPFCMYGGCATTDEHVRARLEAQAQRIADELSVGHLELRNVQSHATIGNRKDLYVRFRKEIDPDPDVNLSRIPRKQRAMVRKGIKAGLRAEVDEDIGRFFDVYSESVRNLGTPVFPRRYFRALKQIFADDCDVLTVTDKGRPVASVLSFYFRNEVLPYYGGGTTAARDVKGNDFMYWELMRRACVRGYNIFDYGRSKKGTGSYSFKKNWGFEPEPLGYEYHLVRAKSVPDINPLNPKYRTLIALWRRLPVSLSRAFGPLLARDLG